MNIDSKKNEDQISQEKMGSISGGMPSGFPGL